MTRVPKPEIAARETAGDESSGYGATPVEDRLDSRSVKRFASQDGFSPVSRGVAG